MSKTLNDKISEFVVRAKEDKTFTGEIVIGVVSASLAKQIKEAVGLRVKEGAEMFIDAHHVRHICNNPNKANINPKDFLFVADVVKHAQVIRKGNQPKRICFEKRIVYDYTCIEAVVSKGNRLQLKTMWVKRKGKK